MMLFGTTRKRAEITADQQWGAISLRDFRSKSVFTYLAYGYLHFNLLLSLAVYGVDIFTAVSLLAFDKWSSSIEPSQLLTFDESKWIFAGSIIASFANLTFEHLRAWRVMHRQSVAECYLDSLAVRLESIKWTSQGFRRFQVFGALTSSKKGAEYVALFTYYSLQSWIRVIVCFGPRQAVNALTLYAVYTSKLNPTDNSSIGSTLGDFFDKLKALYDEDAQQAVVLSGMLFTLVIWVFSFLFLLAGVLFYIFFLRHYIPRQDGGLHGYCERKVNKRLKAIVTKKVNKALAKEEQDRIKAAKKTGDIFTEREATLPSFLDIEKGDDKLPDMPMLSRNETMATLPLYTSRPGTPGSIELGMMDQKRPLPSRSATMATTMSTSSYASRAPLVAGAAEMGYDSQEPTLPNLQSMRNYQTPTRSGTAASNGSRNGPRPPIDRIQTDVGIGADRSLRSPDSLPPMPQAIVSPGSQTSFGGPARPPYSEGRASPVPSSYSNRGPPMGPPSGSAIRYPYDGDRASPAPPAYSNRGPPTRPPFSEGRASPAPSSPMNRGPSMRPPYAEGRSSPAPSYSSRAPSNYQAYNPPARSATNPPMPSYQQRFAPQRNMTAPAPMPQMPREQGDYFSDNNHGGYNGYGQDNSRY
ncbi:hypothetical protein F5Y18DRAFT_427009 [Xylariaceae sp. FL1019]|nr:hypothetical protein F5Y18DRAFT_427009 [Xylariaceae sp. FL1019]